jgi:hypothetical protein
MTGVSRPRLARFISNRRTVMIQPLVVEARQQGTTVEKGQAGKAHEAAGGGLIAPALAAIQHRYEEARANIAGLSDGLWDAAEDLTDPHPDTEAIDIRLVQPPTAYPATTPPTTAMSVAARYLAEQPGDESRPRLERHTASSPRDDEMRAPRPHADSPLVSHRPRRWLRAIRFTLPQAVPAPR